MSLEPGRLYSLRDKYRQISNRELEEELEEVKRTTVKPKVEKKAKTKKK